MNGRFLHPAGQGKTAHVDHLQPVPAAIAAGQACCCPAWPAVQVIMPVTAGRPHETDLLLCAHHYRVSQHALDEAGAVVIELSGHTEDTFLCEVPAPAPATG
ncbi:MAG TPA: hypothetical protein VGI96_31845 [Streptosporangiaceae bacterium]|jgi:hypothetical protein